MKENRFDRVKKLGIERMERALNHATVEWGGSKPFNTQISEAVDYLYTWDRLNLPENQDIKAQITMKYGFDVLAQIEQKALRSRQARGL